MRKNVASDVSLPPLDELDVRLHPLFGERGREEIRDVGVRVETSQGDELPDEAGSKQQEKKRR